MKILNYFLHGIIGFHKKRKFIPLYHEGKLTAWKEAKSRTEFTLRCVECRKRLWSLEYGNTCKNAKCSRYEKRVLIGS